MEKTCLNPATLPAPFGYSQIVLARAKMTVYISGQVPFDTQRELVGKGDKRAQMEQVFRNLEAALKAAGATWKDVVKLTTFVVDFQPEDRAMVAEVRAQYGSAESLPASTLVGVQALAFPELLVEVEATAVID